MVLSHPVLDRADQPGTPALGPRCAAKGRITALLRLAILAAVVYVAVVVLTSLG